MRTFRTSTGVASIAVAIGCVGGLLTTSTATSAEPGEYLEYDLTPLSNPCEVEFAPDGRLWVQEVASNRLGRLDTTTGEYDQFTLPTPGALTAGMEFSPAGNLWLPEVVGNQILRVDPTTGDMTEFTMPWGSIAPDLDLPHGIAVSDDLSFGADGAAWFTLIGLNAIGRMDIQTGEMTKYQIPTPAAGPIIIKPGPGNTMAFVMATGNKIGTIDVFTKEIREYNIPTPASVPFGVTTGPDGMLWFSEAVGQKFGKIDPTTGQVTEYDMISLRLESGLNGFLDLGNPLPFPGPLDFADDGNLYITEGGFMGGNKIAQYDLQTGKLKEFTTQSAFSGPCDLNVERPGEIWSGLFSANKVGVLHY